MLRALLVDIAIYSFMAFRARAPVRERMRAESMHTAHTARSRPAGAIEVLAVRSTAAATEEEGLANASSSRSPPLAFSLQGLGPIPSHERIGNCKWWNGSVKQPTASTTSTSSSLHGKVRGFHASADSTHLGIALLTRSETNPEQGRNAREFAIRGIILPW